MDIGYHTFAYLGHQKRALGITNQKITEFEKLDRTPAGQRSRRCSSKPPVYQLVPVNLTNSVQFDRGHVLEQMVQQITPIIWLNLGKSVLS